MAADDGQNSTRHKYSWSKNYSRVDRIAKTGVDKLRSGYQRVTIHIESDKQGQALWLRATGSMNGYSLENANKLTFVSRMGTAPCSCMLLDEFHAYYYGEIPDAIADCRPQCPGE